MSEFLQVFCPRFVCFHIHTGFARGFFNIFFLLYPPPDLPEDIDKAAHPAQIGIFDGKRNLERANSPFPVHGSSNRQSLAPNPESRLSGQASSTQVSMLLFLGFVK